MLTSMFYEEEDRFSLGELVSAMISHSLVLVCSASALCVLAARWLTTLFLGDNPAVLSIAVPGLRLYALALIPCAVSTQYKYYFQGVQHIENTYLAGFLESLGCTTLLSWLLSRFLGLRGVWLGLPAGQLATLFIICILIWRKYGAVSFSGAAPGRGPLCPHRPADGHWNGAGGELRQLPGPESSDTDGEQVSQAPDRDGIVCCKGREISPISAVPPQQIPEAHRGNPFPDLDALTECTSEHRGRRESLRRLHAPLSRQKSGPHNELPGSPREPGSFLGAYPPDGGNCVPLM
jgi:hypothetical protein